MSVYSKKFSNTEKVSIDRAGKDLFRDVLESFLARDVPLAEQSDENVEYVAKIRKEMATEGNNDFKSITKLCDNVLGYPAFVTAEMILFKMETMVSMYNGDPAYEEAYRIINKSLGLLANSATPTLRP